MSKCRIIPAMTPASASAASPDHDPAASQSKSPQPASSSHHRLLHREGAIVFLSAAEQALEDTMLRSSLPPEQVLGKRAHEQDDEQNAGDTEPEEGTSAVSQVQLLAPSLSNVTAATLRYAMHKKLRAEQRDELDSFLQVST